MRPDAETWGEDTIAAISTAVGAGAIGIIKLSGPDAVAIASLAFRPARAETVLQRETHCLVYGHVTDPSNGELIDEALMALMRAPHSYTREDVVELHCHGGLAAQRAVLRLVVNLGARLAEPGEFTRRAFLNGRLDLAQAESVAGIVAARSSGALRASVRQLQGGLSEKLSLLRRELVGLLAQVEATVDFYDEDTDPVDWNSMVGRLSSVHDDLARLIRTAFLGRALEQGVRTAIVGKPNVGKSSLLNALLMRERAIVSELPGTTRDTVEELVEIGGIPIHLVDTAGIRRGGDRVEQLGVERSVQALAQADLVLAVFDLAGSWEDADGEVLRGLDPGRSIIVWNKCDLVTAGARTRASGFEHEYSRGQDNEGRSDEGCDRKGRDREGQSEDGQDGEGQRGAAPHECVVSAVTGRGIDELRERIQQIVTGGEGLHLEEPVLATERQRVLAGDALGNVASAVASAGSGCAEELICEDIRGAVRALGRITGEEMTTDLLDEIFSRFCLGK